MFEFVGCLYYTVQSVFRELVFRGRSGFRGLRFLKREFSRAKRIWIQRTVWIQGPRMPTRRLFSKSRLSCISIAHPQAWPLKNPTSIHRMGDMKCSFLLLIEWYFECVWAFSAVRNNVKQLWSVQIEYSHFKWSGQSNKC